jgi:hypothetical protein
MTLLCSTGYLGEALAIRRRLPRLDQISQRYRTCVVVKLVADMPPKSKNPADQVLSDVAPHFVAHFAGIVS